MAHQPGLEVVVPPTDPEIASKAHSTWQNSHIQLDTSPEVVPIELLQRQSHRPEAIYASKESEKEPTIVTSKERSHLLAKPTPRYLRYLKGRHGRLFTLIGVGVIIIVVVAAVVGGVIGSRRSHSVSSTAAPGTPTSSPSPPRTTTTPSRPLQSNSGLAVAGWRKQNDFFNLRIFYQDQDDGLRFAEYRSDGAGWGGSTKVDREDVLSNTTLGATVILQMNPVSP